jgi:hypothetical protein
MARLGAAKHKNETSIIATSLVCLKLPRMSWLPWRWTARPCASFPLSILRGFVHNHGLHALDEDRETREVGLRYKVQRWAGSNRQWGDAEDMAAFS